MNENQKNFNADEKVTLRSAASYLRCVLLKHNVNKNTKYCYTCKKQH